jgi:hypothetical protein
VLGVLGMIPVKARRVRGQQASYFSRSIFPSSKSECHSLHLSHQNNSRVLKARLQRRHRSLSPVQTKAPPQLSQECSSGASLCPHRAHSNETYSIRTSS